MIITFSTFHSLGPKSGTRAEKKRAGQGKSQCLQAVHKLLDTSHGKSQGVREVLTLPWPSHAPSLENAELTLLAQLDLLLKGMKRENENGMNSNYPKKKWNMILPCSNLPPIEA